MFAIGHPSFPILSPNMRVAFYFPFFLLPYILLSLRINIGSLGWNIKIVGKGYTFPKPNVLEHRPQSGYGGHNAMANYVIKAKEWKVFAWEFRWRFPLNFFCKQIITYRFTLLDSNGWGICPGFMKAPFDKYIAEFCSNWEKYYTKDWGWGLRIEKGKDYIDQIQNGRNGYRWMVKGMEIKNGDKFGFRVDFDKRICDIFYNGKEARNGFSEIPDEIIPLISDEGYGEMSVSIEFLNGIARVYKRLDP